MVHPRNSMSNSFIFVYILLLSNNTYYTGLTDNIIRRFSEHNNGQSKSTRNALPVSLQYVETLPDRKKARKREVYIKKHGAGRFLNKFRYTPVV